MIMIIGDWRNDAKKFDKAKEQLLDTERYHKIYGTSDIINLCELFNVCEFLSETHQLDIALHMLSWCDTVYMLKSWETSNDARLLHDYASSNGYKIIYSKKY